MVVYVTLILRLTDKHKLVSTHTCILFSLSHTHTFAHIADLLLEDVVAVLVHVRAQEVLEAVVDLQAGRCHGDPLPDRVALHVLQVLDALDHLLVLQALARPLRRPLGEAAPPGRRPLIILILAVCQQ